MAYNRETIFLDGQRSPMALCLSYGEGEDSFQRKKDVDCVNKTPVPPKTPVKFSPWFRMELERKASLVTFHTDRNNLLPLSDLYNRGHPDSYMNQVFKDVTLVGEGHYGKVYRVVSREDDKVYAIKVSKEIFHNESEKLKRFEEVRKHEMVPVHPNCVRLFSAWQEKAKLYLWLEFCDTSLESYAAKNHDIGEDKVWNILLDLLLGLKNLHDNNLIHVDVKLDNILMTNDGVCKLADFGLLIDMSQGSMRLKHAVEGDGRYLAPELLKGGPFSAAADVFSLGLCILELAADIVMPMGGEDWQMLRRGEIPLQKTLHLSPELKAVISNMLTPDYLLRPSVDKLLTQPRLQQMWSERRNKSPSTYSGGFHFSCIKNLASFLIMLFFVLVKMAENICRKVRRQTIRPTVPTVTASPGCPRSCPLPAPVLRNPNSRLFSRSLQPSKRHCSQGEEALLGGDSPVSARVAMQLSDEEVEVSNGLNTTNVIGALASSTPCKPLGSAKGWSSVRRGLCDSVISQRTLDFSQDCENECDHSPNTPARWSSLNSPFSRLHSEGDKSTVALDDSQGATPLSTSQNSVGVSSTPQLISPMPRKSLLHIASTPLVGRNLLDSFNSSDEDMSDGEKAKRKKRERKKR